MIIARPFGDFRSDVVSVLDLIPGISTTKANDLVTQAEAFIRARAKEGAEQAIPTIETKVRQAAAGAIPEAESRVKRVVIVGGLVTIGASALIAALVARAGRRK